MKNLNCLFILLFVPMISFAQINYTVKGKAITQKGLLVTGNVMALHPHDSTLIKGDFFMDGAFELTDLKEKEILLQLSSLEFGDTYISVRFEQESLLDLGEILVASPGIDLNEIVVKTKRPVYKQHADGTVEVLIENTTLAASNSVNEILTRSPEIMTDESGNISVFGKGEAIIYLNNKRVTNEQLSLIAPSNIKKIEIIRNPSAKYDAEGAAVINITTIKKQGDGYQAKLQQNISHSPFGGTNYNTSLNLNYNKGRFSSRANYGLLLGRNRELLYTTRDRDDEAVFLKTDLTTDWQRKMKNYSTFGLGLQYELNNSSYLSAEYAGFSNSLGGNQLSNNTITDSESVSFYESDIARDEVVNNHSLSLNYQKNLDTLGSSLFIGGQYLGFQSDFDNLITEESIEENVSSSRLLKNLFTLNINILTAQADYQKVFKNKNTLELGMKYSQVENDSKLNFLTSNNATNFNLDERLSNAFNYQETIGAAYISYKGAWSEGLDYTIGLRSEFTQYNLNLAQIENADISDKYLNFFPNFSLNKKFSAQYNLNFSYTYRIARPTYQSLNPVVFYQDPYTSITGNPNLVPQRTHGFELNSKLNQTTFKLGYTYATDPFGGGAIRGEDFKSYVLIRLNFDKRHRFSSSISRTFRTKWWTSMNTVSLQYTNVIETEFDFQKVIPRPNLYVYSNNTFNVANVFNAEVSLWYRGDNYEGVFHRKKMFNLGFAIDKSFFNNALKVRLIANDILHTVIASGYYSVGETDIYFNRRWSTNYVRLSATYNFGKLEKANYKNKSVGGSERQRAF